MEMIAAWIVVISITSIQNVITHEMTSFKLKGLNIIITCQLLLKTLYHGTRT